MAFPQLPPRAQQVVPTQCTFQPLSTCPCTWGWRQILRVSCLLNFPSAPPQPSPQATAASGLARAEPRVEQGPPSTRYVPGRESLTIQPGILASGNFTVAPQAHCLLTSQIFRAPTLKLCRSHPSCFLQLQLLKMRLLC